MLGRRDEGTRTDGARVNRCRNRKHSTRPCSPVITLYTHHIAIRRTPFIPGHIPGGIIRVRKCIPMLYGRTTTRSLTPTQQRVPRTNPPPPPHSLFSIQVRPRALFACSLQFVSATRTVVASSIQSKRCDK